MTRPELAGPGKSLEVGELACDLGLLIADLRQVEADLDFKDAGQIAERLRRQRVMLVRIAERVGTWAGPARLTNHEFRNP